LKIFAGPGFRPLLIAALLSASHARAQAVPTAAKANDLSVFAGGSYSNPEYGPFYDKGISFGANLVEHLNRHVDPSLEARFNLTSGTDVNEKTALVGVRAQTTYHVLHPYGDFLIGGGNIKFNLSNGQSYTTNNSTVLSYGGGLDLDVYRQYQLKLDIQQQHWLLGDQPFQPWIAVVGVTYRFHFRDYNKQGDMRR